MSRYKEYDKMVINVFTGDNYIMPKPEELIIFDKDTVYCSGDLYFIPENYKFPAPITITGGFLGRTYGHFDINKIKKVLGIGGTIVERIN